MNKQKDRENAKKYDNTLHVPEHRSDGKVLYYEDIFPDMINNVLEEIVKVDEFSDDDALTDNADEFLGMSEESPKYHYSTDDEDDMEIVLEYFDRNSRKDCNEVMQPIDNFGYSSDGLEDESMGSIENFGYSSDDTEEESVVSIDDNFGSSSDGIQGESLGSICNLDELDPSSADESYIRNIFHPKKPNPIKLFTTNKKWLLAFFGALAFTGVYKYKAAKDYWHNLYGIPFLRERISRSQFMNHLSKLCFPMDEK